VRSRRVGGCAVRDVYFCTGEFGGGLFDGLWVLDNGELCVVGVA